MGTTTEIIRFGTDFKDTIKNNKRLHWMISTMFAYGNCCLDTEACLHFTVEQLEKGLEEILKVPVKVREAEVYNYNKNVPLDNKAYIAELTNEDFRKIKELYMNDFNYYQTIVYEYGVDENLLPHNTGDYRKNVELF